MTEKKNLSFGRYLRAAREARAIDLRSVSRQTRIGTDILRAIEDEDHEQLPAEVFVKGFIRAYARIVGADGDSAVARYLQSRQLLEATVRAETDRIHASSRFWPRLMVILAGFAVIVALALVVAPLPGSGPEAPAPEPATVAPPPKAHGPARGETPAPALEPSPVPRTEPTKSPGPVEAEKQAAVSASDVPAIADLPAAETADLSQPDPEHHLLAIEAREETWMKIIVDNLAAREYTLRPGDRLELEARESFNLLIGNAGGITASLDGKAMPVPGKSGQVVNLKLP